MSSMWMMRHMQQDQSKPTVPITKTYRRLLREVLSQRGRLLLAAALVLSISMLSLVMPQMTQAAIDNAIPHGQMPLLWWLGLAILLSSMLSGLLTFGQSYLMSVIGQSVVFNLRNKLYNHLQALSMSFFDSRRTGELMSRVTNDIGALQNLITSGVVQLATDSVTFLVVLGILFWDDWRLTLLILATFPFMMITTSRFGQRIRGAYKEVQEGIATVNEHLQDTIASIKVVKSFANERYESERFEERNRRNMDANVKAVRVWSMFFPVLDTLNNFGTVIILIFGGYEVLHGRLTIGQFVVFNTYLRMMSQPVRRFGRMMNTIQQGAAAGERVFEILDTKPDVVDKPDAVELPALRGHVRFEDVTFGYKKDEPVL